MPAPTPENTQGALDAIKAEIIRILNEKFPDGIFTPEQEQAVIDFVMSQAVNVNALIGAARLDIARLLTTGKSKVQSNPSALA